MSAISAVFARFGFDFPGLFNRPPRVPEPPRRVFDPRTATAEELYEHYRLRME